MTPQQEQIFNVFEHGAIILHTAIVLPAIVLAYGWWALAAYGLFMLLWTMMAGWKATLEAMTQQAIRMRLLDEIVMARRKKDGVRGH